MIRDGEIRIDRDYHNERVRVNKLEDDLFSITVLSWDGDDRGFLNYATSTEADVKICWPELDETDEVQRLLEEYDE
jgi:hypothetical protein